MTEEEHKILACFAANPHKLGLLVGLDKLSALHSRWIRHCWVSDEHTSLQAHRGSYKSTSVSVLGAIWWLIFNPEETIAICRKTHTEACDNLGAIMKVFENADVRALFTMAHGKQPQCDTNRGNRVAFNFKTSVTKEGSIDVYGVESSLTGTHYGKMILDDIVTLKDRLSRAEREHTKEFLREVLTNIINPGKQVSHVGTPWHKDDAWTISPTPIMRYNVSQTGILTPEQIAEKRSRTTPSLWAANYDLVHQSDERALFRDPRYGIWQHSPMKAVAHVDAAFGGDHFNGFTIARRVGLGADKGIQVVGKCWEGHIKHRYREMVELCRQYRADTLYIEMNADKGFTGEAIRETAHTMGYGLAVKDYQERQNKANKIATTVSYFWPELIFDQNETDDEYMKQVVDWIEGQEPDDAIDSLASICLNAFGTPKGRDPMAMFRL